QHRGQAAGRRAFSWWCRPDFSSGGRSAAIATSSSALGEQRLDPTASLSVRGALPYCGSADPLSATRRGPPREIYITKNSRTLSLRVDLDEATSVGARNAIFTTACVAYYGRPCTN